MSWNCHLSCARWAAPGLPTEEGDWRLIVYESHLPGDRPLALVMGEISEGDAVLVRVHSECFTGDVLGSVRCDCGAQLQAAKEAIAAVGQGVIVYLRQEGLGIGLVDKLRAYELQVSEVIALRRSAAWNVAHLLAAERARREDVTRLIEHGFGRNRARAEPVDRLLDARRHRVGDRELGAFASQQLAELHADGTEPLHADPQPRHRQPEPGR